MIKTRKITVVLAWIVLAVGIVGVTIVLGMAAGHTPATGVVGRPVVGSTTVMTSLIAA